MRNIINPSASVSRQIKSYELLCTLTCLAKLKQDVIELRCRLSGMHYEDKVFFLRQISGGTLQNLSESVTFKNVDDLIESAWGQYKDRVKSSLRVDQGVRLELPQLWADFLNNDSFHWNWYGHFTFRDYPHIETACKAWDKFIHLLNRECFGVRYWQDKTKGVTWARGTEDQKRGAVHFHAIIGNIPDRVRRMDYVDKWFNMAGIGRIYAYEKDRGAEFYMSKSTYAWKRGEIDLSETMEYHLAEMVLPSVLR